MLVKNIFHGRAYFTKGKLQITPTNGGADLVYFDFDQLFEKL